MGTAPAKGVIFVAFYRVKEMTLMATTGPAFEPAATCGRSANPIVTTGKATGIAAYMRQGAALYVCKV